MILKLDTGVKITKQQEQDSTTESQSEDEVVFIFN